MHRHVREDEYSYVFEGRVGAMLGDQVVEAGPGSLIFKPRQQWHTFWNAGESPARILEIISPAGFERYFAELVALGGSRVASASPEVLPDDIRSRWTHSIPCSSNAFSCVSASPSRGE
jgi:hypothetical protein